MKPADLLAQFRVYDRCYSIGPFFLDGVTILKQQIRALNLVYALAETNRIRSGFSTTPMGVHPTKIAVVGGGVAGMTAAIAAVMLGNNVSHFEQRPMLCHLQAGCDTRWVHPHIYDWPSRKSENPYAGLPILNWQAGTASEVARCLVDAYDDERFNALGKLTRHLGATTFVNGTTVKWDNSDTAPRGGNEEFQEIILAAGFGVEQGVRDGSVLSYWRNDSLNQARPGITSEKGEIVFVSGAGDGGLIDLLRSKLDWFNQAWILDDLFPFNTDPLLDALRTIQKQPSYSPGWLFDRYEKVISDGNLKGEVEIVRSLLGKRIRKEVAVILNGRPKVFRELLNLRSSSLLNSFLTFLLYRDRCFTYVSGEYVKHGEKDVTIEHQASRAKSNSKISSTYAVDRVLIRHGTDKVDCLRMLGLPLSKIKKLQRTQEAAPSALISEQNWGGGWWKKDKRAKVGRKEFLPPASQAIATTFTSTLANMFRFEQRPHGNSFPRFRLTVHRAIEIRDEIFFQQMSDYGGDLGGGDPRRIFDLSVGLVGLVFRTGKPIALQHGSNWDVIWDRLQTGGAERQVRSDSKNSRSSVALPILAPGGKRTALVIYADSHDVRFLNADRESSKSSAKLTMLFNAVVGFVNNCNHLARNDVIRFARSSFLGVPCKKHEDDEVIMQEFSKEVLDATSLISGYDRKQLIGDFHFHWDCIYKAHIFVPSLKSINPPLSATEGLPTS